MFNVSERQPFNYRNVLISAMSFFFILNYLKKNIRLKSLKMTDFKKGLIVGMVIIFGFGAFVASTTNNANSQRYELHGGLMLDCWKGNLYVMPNNKEDEEKTMDQRKNQN